MTDSLAATGDQRTPLWRRARNAAREVLPRGGALPQESWRRRHRGITVLLWAHVVALPMIGAFRAQSPGYILLEAAVLAGFALGASSGHLSVTMRSAMATLGLVSSAAILVQVFDGMNEMHYHFFVMVAVVALYQTWPPYLLAVGFVLAQHGIVGAFAPYEVYSQAAGWHHPWTFALLHGFFLLAESVTFLVYWRVSEDALDHEREARARTEAAHRDLEQAQSLSNVGSWDWDISSDRVTWSDHLYMLTGLDRATFSPAVTSFLDLVHPDDRDRVGGLITQAVVDGVGLDYEARLIRADGQIRVFHALGEREMTANGMLVRMFGTFHDITETNALQEEIERLAFHDPLTGLANRRLFLDRLEHALDGQKRSGRGCSVLFMDLDDFKKVNDDLGHSAGDELLCVVTGRLEAAVRSADTVARLGGDEFAILLEGVDLETSTLLAQRLEAEICRPIQLPGAELSIRGSIGVAMADGDISADDILRDADAAMYAVKTGGRKPQITVGDVPGSGEGRRVDAAPA